MEIKVTANTSNSASKVVTNKKSSSKTDTVMNLGNVNSNNKTNKKDDFRDVLKSTEKGKNDSAVSENVVKDDTKAEVVNTDEINEKIDELKEKIDDAPEDEIASLLDVIANMLMKLQQSEKESVKPSDVNSELLQTLLQKLDGAKESTEPTVKVDLNDLINKLTKVLDNDEVLSKLDSTSSELLEKLLAKLSSSIEDKSDLNSNVKDLVKNLQSKVQESNSGKPLSLVDLLNKNNNLDNNTSKENESNNDLSKQESTSNKDNEFLNKFLNKDSTDDKISMFTFRNALAQNTSVNSTQANSVTDVSKVTFAKDLIQDIRYMATNSIKELIVKVNPQNLGQITIKIAEENGVMKATLKANSKETTELMVQNVAEIKKALDSQNIKIADVNIELYQDDTTFFKQESFEDQMNQKQENQINNDGNSSVEMSEEIEDTEENASENSNVNFLA